MNHKHIVPLIIALICIALIALCVVIAVPAAAYEERVTTEKQKALHEAAEILRAAGYKDDDHAVRALSEEWWAEQAKLDSISEAPLSRELQAALIGICDDTGVDPRLALGLIETESGFQVDIVSPWGDYGLCQLNKLYFPSDLTPEENLRAGIGLLGRNIERYGSVDAALTAYNRGYDDGTRYYARVVLKNAAKWGYSYAG